MVAAVLFSLLPLGAAAYTGQTDAVGGVSATIGNIEAVTALNAPREVTVSFKNDAATAVTVSLSARSIEPVTAAFTAKTLDVPAGGSANATLRITCGDGTYNAHYPVHVLAEFQRDGKTFALKPVQVFTVNVRDGAGAGRKLAGRSEGGREVFVGETVADAKNLPLLIVPDGGGVALTQTDAYRVLWWRDRERDAGPRVLAVGWQGREDTSGMNFARVLISRGGVSRQSLIIHPPYQGGAGTMFTEYRVRLPKTTPITFSSFVAMRDIYPPEPESDGVTFAVWIGEEKIAEKHWNEKTWGPLEADLSKFAGQTVLLRLQSDPGPKRDTTCDGAYWGTPLLRVGQPPKQLTAEEKKVMFEENLKALKEGKSTAKSFDAREATVGRTVVYELDGGLRAAVTFGHYGFLDGVIGFGDHDRQVQYDGVRVNVDGQPVGGEASALAWSELMPTSVTYAVTQNVDSLGKRYNLNYSIRSDGFTVHPNGSALHLNVGCVWHPQAITNIELGPATRHADRVYFGHGYCIDQPERFEVRNGGHELSTSHVGFDFDNGLSILLATTTPPEKLIVDPASKTYTLSVNPGTRLILLPGVKGAMDCAIRYRPLYDKKAAPGVAKKAGRFVFDVWGGRYGDHLAKIREQIDYGVTDALIVIHDWQRWGYDNRLPDIWPPASKYGTLNEMKELLDLCKKHNILYALHDNYIDIYPDADDFSYDLVSFEANGLPRRAWNNVHIGSQSYQLRPDKIAPLLERNFHQMLADGFSPTAYFVDVFASMPLHDFWDRDGRRHSRTEMLAHWNQSFDTIRQRLGGAVTISEAGSDFLIGHLDGADCQFLTLADEPGESRNVVRCKGWIRVPWFDAVNHTRFSLHGVGYEYRYAANRGLELYGYMSDDYMTSEVLTGHALQVGHDNIGRDSVRKYWLLQGVARNLADAEITEVNLPKDMFRPPDRGAEMGMSRYSIMWSNGTLIEMPTTAQGEPSPPLMVIMGDNLLAGIFPMSSFGTRQFPERFDEQLVEFSDALVGDERWVYFNPRQYGSGALPVMPTAKSFEQAGDNQFKLAVEWNVLSSLKARHEMRRDVKNYNYFLHLEPPQMNWYDQPKLTVIGGGKPPTPVSEWEKSWTQNFDITVPSDLPGGVYNVLVGLWDADGTKERADLLGPCPGHRRILLGRLTVQRGGATKLTFAPETESPDRFARLLPAPKEALDAIVASGEKRPSLPFPLRATGGVQLRYAKTAAVGDDIPDRLELTVTPLPGEPATRVVILADDSLRSLVPKTPYTTCDSLTAVDRAGKTLRDVPHTLEHGELRFETRFGEFAYKIVLKK